MDVTASGPPKAGTHALAKACRLLGLLSAPGLHWTVGSPVQRPHVFIKRDPRNMVVSWLRWTGRPVAAESFIAALSKFYSGQLFSQELSGFQGWLTDPDTLVVSYESLMANDLEMRRIADYCGVPYVAGAFEHLPGETRTWRDGRSDHRLVWSQDVEKAWVAQGGVEILAAWGYQ